ncbi:hypothetical protein HK103_004687 [Boothiomyces macroporosus]|uniref:PNPLA domain-containing protein n=1 Tax=Boothiomyces macroporosus TaxID=261099 RepID=A0AAD5Y6Q4_9FUNG|nr:hypothetical protein HK103_004687 [Boothiomyces macroporosus]
MEIKREIIKWFAFIAEQIVIVILIAQEIIYTQFSNVYSSLNVMDDVQRLQIQLKEAEDYHTWASIAQQLDDKQAALQQALVTEDYPAMKLLIRSGLLRNLGGIMDHRLFEKTNFGTKTFIEEYLNLVTECIQKISDLPATENQKLEIINDVSQSFGNTALLLHGGATFGLYHLGVVKALSENGLLPKIISGSSVGALIAALICTHREEDLPKLFLPDGIDLKAFARKERSGSIRRKITRLLTHGYLLDVKVLEDCVKANLGDMTFEEAFLETGMVLNITVTSSRKNEIPSVLNYLTSPNVLIRSAACASTSMIGLYNSVDLLAKNKDGQIFVWSPTSIKWGNTYADNDSPDQRLAELFNVNHFILSQAQPYIAPFLRKGPRITGRNFFQKILAFISSEIRFRMTQLARIGLIPKSVGSLFDLKIVGHVTIAPALSSLDFYTIFGNPTYESLSYWIKKGEKSTWPFLEMIRCRLMIEMKLYEVKQQQSALMNELRTNVFDLKNIMKKRTQSIG